MDDVEYVEGEIVSSWGIVMAHAWNCVDGKHVDLTFEFNDEIDSLQFPHYAVVQGTIEKLQTQGYEIDLPKDLFTQWLNRPEQKKCFERSPFDMTVTKKLNLSNYFDAIEADT